MSGVMCDSEEPMPNYRHRRYIGYGVEPWAGARSYGIPVAGWFTVFYPELFLDVLREIERGAWDVLEIISVDEEQVWW